MRTFSRLAAHIAIAGLALMPALASAQANCGVPGTPPCPTPEPGTWPLVALALGVLVAVKFIKRK